jgi:hypothetical protein
MNLYYLAERLWPVLPDLAKTIEEAADELFYLRERKAEIDRLGLANCAIAKALEEVLGELTYLREYKAAVERKGLANHAGLFPS